MATYMAMKTSKQWELGKQMWPSSSFLSEALKDKVIKFDEGNIWRWVTSYYQVEEEEADISL